METIRKIYDAVFRGSTSQADLKSVARLSEEEVNFIADECAKSVGWINDGNLYRHFPQLERDVGLVWHVVFTQTEDILPVKGGQLRILIDDETGSVIKEIAGTR